MEQTWALYTAALFYVHWAAFILTCLHVDLSARYECTECAVLARDQHLTGVQPVTTRHLSTLRRCGGEPSHSPQSA